jgi:hypothetical protein
MAVMKRWQAVTSAEKEGEELEPSHIADGNVEWCGYLGNCFVFLENHTT